MSRISETRKDAILSKLLAPYTVLVKSSVFLCIAGAGRQPVR
jgi:hypothetical protein